MADISSELIIPVYLNQRVVFDLVAMLQGGISTVTRVTSLESSLEKDQQQYGAAFGLSKALSTLFKIDVSGTRQKSQEDTQGIQKAEERVHTPASMFQSLRARLTEKKELTEVHAGYKPKTRDIIEFTAQLQKNPLIQTMDTFVGMMEMAILFSGQPTPLAKHKGGKSPAPNENIFIKKQMEQFLESLKTGDTVDIVSDTLQCGYKAIITLEREFLNDPTMSDLVDGQFNVLGKVIRVIDTEDDSINLIRKTAVSAMPEKLMSGAFSGFEALSKEQGYKIPPIELEIKGPVIQILPIAIFA